jgi:hypothetical protein
MSPILVQNVLVLIPTADRYRIPVVFLKRWLTGGRCSGRPVFAERTARRARCAEEGYMRKKNGREICDLVF